MHRRYIKIAFWVLVLNLILGCSAMDDCWDERLTKIIKFYSSYGINTEEIYFHDDKIYPECTWLGEKNKRDKDFTIHAYAHRDKQGRKLISFAPHIIDEMNDSVANKKPFSAFLTQLLLHEYAHHHLDHIEQAKLWIGKLFKRPTFSEEYLLHCGDSTELPEFPEDVIVHNFERGQEFAADAWAFERMTVKELKDYLATRFKQSAYEAWQESDRNAYSHTGGLPREVYAACGFDSHHPNGYQQYWLAEAILRKKTHNDESSLNRVTRNFFALNRDAQKSEKELKHALAGILLG